MAHHLNSAPESNGMCWVEYSWAKMERVKVPLVTMPLSQNWRSCTNCGMFQYMKGYGNIKTVSGLFRKRKRKKGFRHWLATHIVRHGHFYKQATEAMSKYFESRRTGQAAKNDKMTAGLVEWAYHTLQCERPIECQTRTVSSDTCRKSETKIITSHSWVQSDMPGTWTLGQGKVTVLKMQDYALLPQLKYFTVRILSTIDHMQQARVAKWPCATATMKIWRMYTSNSHFLFLLVCVERALLLLLIKPSPFRLCDMLFKFYLLWSGGISREAITYHTQHLNKGTHLGHL